MAGTITEAYGISMLSKKHVLIRNMRKTLSEPDIHGDQIWSSSFLIMDYLLYHRLRPKTRVMELGCGWGLLSAFCAREFDARVTAVDADEKVFPYVHVHAVLNDVRVETRCNRYEKITSDELKAQRVLLGADICFWDELVLPLFRVVKRAVGSGVGRIVIADPGRQPFLDLADKCKKNFNARLIDWEVDEPTPGSGYLLEIRQ